MPNEKLDLSLREATPADDSFLLEVYASTRIDELEPFGWDDNQKQAFIKMQFLARERTYPRVDSRIILLSGRPVGTLLVERNESRILLRDIALLKEFRNAGIGSQLVEELIREASEARKPIDLHVLITSPAVRFYERLGFQRSDTSSDGAYLGMRWMPS